MLYLKYVIKIFCIKRCIKNIQNTLSVQLISFGGRQGNVNIQNELSRKEFVSVIAKDRGRTDRFAEAAVYGRPHN